MRYQMATNDNLMIKAWIKTNFPSYRKRSFTLCIQDNVEVSACSQQWDGGSKTYYTFIGPTIKEGKGEVTHEHNWYGGTVIPDIKYTLNNGDFVIEIDRYMTVHCNAETAKSLLAYDII